jgi:hypothetical protein
MEGLRNVFDNKEEFEKLHSFIMEGIKHFSEYRAGNLTYGEIMFVLEAMLDGMRDTSEKRAKTSVKGFGRDVTFTALYELVSRMVETLVKKGVLTTKNEAYIIHGEE